MAWTCKATDSSRTRDACTSHSQTRPGTVPGTATVEASNGAIPGDANDRLPSSFALGIAAQDPGEGRQRCAQDAMESVCCEPPCAPGEGTMRPRRCVLAQALVLVGLLLSGCTEGADGLIPVQSLSPPRKPTGDVTPLSSVPAPDLTQTPGEIPIQVDEEYAVYRAAIAALFAAEDLQFIVLRDHTAPHVPSGGSLDIEMAYVRRELGSVLESETLESYKARNETTMELGRAFSVDKHFALLSDGEIDKIFETADGWAQFYAIYPGSQGIMTLSRVGFNREMDQALVYLGNQADYLAGRGYYVLLSKKGQAWTLEELATAWTS